MVQQTVEEKRKLETLIEKHDKEKKNELKTLREDVDFFIMEKKTMTPLEKWEAFRKLVDNQELFTYAQMIDFVNSQIRIKGLRWND
jgi:hypothetical protein